MIQPQDEAAQAKTTILIVEDDVNARFILAEFLRSSGYIVVEACSADEAFVFLSGPHDVSLVITDVRMPGTIDGVSLARLIGDSLPDVKVIVTSGHLEPEQAPAGTTFVRKPYILRILLDTVHSLLPEDPASQ